MTLLQAILLGLLQGITEFLPISSSGHLVFAESFLGLGVQDLKDFDIALHTATLLAILIYFRRDFLKTKWWPYLILASIPAALIGFFLEAQIDATFRNIQSVALFMIIVGLLFFIDPKSDDKKLNGWRALTIGVAQALAIIPGISRSGATVFTGIHLGLKHTEAARFSFLLGSLAIAGAGLLTALDKPGIALPLEVFIAGFSSAFLSSLLAVSFLMTFLKNHSLKIFGLYRVLLGLIVLIGYTF